MSEKRTGFVTSVSPVSPRGGQSMCSRPVSPRRVVVVGVDEQVEEPKTTATPTSRPPKDKKERKHLNLVTKTKGESEERNLTDSGDSMTPEKKFERRSFLVKEIVSTEQTYVDSLEKLNTIIAPLLDPSYYIEEFNIIQDLQLINSNAGIIIRYSKLLLEDLVPRAESFSTTTCIGDIFLILADYMKVYTQYIKVYEPFMSKFVQCMNKNKVLKEKMNQSEFLAFESCLICPVQRIPRYQLLIQDLLKVTPQEHPDYPQLQQALKKVAEIGNFVNEMQKFYEGINRVLELHRLFGKQLTDGTGVTEFVRSHRRFLKDGALLFLEAEQLVPVRVYLLNDIFLIGKDSKIEGKKNKKLKKLICLWLAELHDLPDTETLQNAFKFSQENSPDIILVGNSPQEKELWMTVITEAKQVLSNAIASADVENDKLYVDEGVRWNRPEIPMEILMALKEEQAIKRNKSQILSLEPSLVGTKKSRSSTASIKSPRDGLGGSRIEISSHSNGESQDPPTRPRLKRPSSFYQLGQRVSSTLTVVNKLTRSDSDNSENSQVEHEKPKESPRPVEPEKEFIGTMFIRVLEARKVKFKSSSETKSLFVTMKFSNKTVSTNVCKKSVHPVWNDNNQFTFDLYYLTDSDTEMLDVSLWNRHSAVDTCEGEISIKIDKNNMSSRLADKWFILKKKNHKTAELRIQLHFKSVVDLALADEPEMDVFEDKTAREDLTLSEQRLVEYISNLGGVL